MLPGGTSQEVTQLNIESLWSGGPFQDPVRVAICKLSDVQDTNVPTLRTVVQWGQSSTFPAVQNSQ
jgi:alpha-L-fucosidase 2